MLKRLIFPSTLSLSMLMLTLLSTCPFLSGCTPRIYKPGPYVLNGGQILENRYVTSDGIELPLRQWLPEHSKASAVLIALHGFNDYSHFLQQPGDFFRQQGIISYAYDQRGFGGSPHRGLWSGVDAYVQDLDLFVRLIRNKHPGLPVYLLGESMGGAVIIATMARSLKTPVDGLILAAPAVWGRETMPWYQQTLLWALSHTMPWLTLTGKGVVKVTPSDNIEMLRALSRDPMVIKATRVEAMSGLADLMDIALHSAKQIEADTLVLYGDKDEIVPKQPTYRFLQDFLQTRQQRKRVAFYENGYHMLLRDRQAPILWNDIVAWIKSSSAPLPSGADKYAEQVLAAANGDDNS
ncbi:alpha/beta hydrolase [Methylobacter sp. BlB1]|jgi:acylglycerol lipase|uniref:alpha/beta hydrolase n=1 Tax=unclassified Methylobacter TaxID=2635283 RepID=UPI001E6405E8|nr:alpha/beta hydrolase [Methylobacter sp. BlB1]